MSSISMQYRGFAAAPCPKQACAPDGAPNVTFTASFIAAIHVRCVFFYIPIHTI
ncbi:hypothetical protein [Treponema endosymbiont of Eucomonympha sp.]|uniref:hypothetical protein n=1 Tax=Treponema endosymbiont of Eucomonympha sp. TaxID=1580831 RepID=UPI00164F36EE|nr:hypothetical protein [Treponema endosymbiont of Eucomonympha sp.]